GSPDDVVVPVTIDTRSNGQAVSIIMGGILPSGNYRLQVSPSILADRAGNVFASTIERHFSIRPASDVRAINGVPDIPTAPSANPGQQIGLAVPFDPSTARAEFKVIDGGGTVTTRVLNPGRVDSVRGIAFFTVPIDAVTGDAVVYSQVGATRTDFPDGTFPLQILPTITDVQIESVAADGSTAQVLIAGTGLVEGNGSEYRFGSAVVLDAGINTGPDVFARYDATLGYVPNGYVRLTLPLSNGVFGAISIKTAGGVSASFTVGLSSITGVALSGTPTDAAQASANPGQAVTLNGSGLSTATDVLLSYRDYNGTLQMVRLSPSAATADGTSATLVVPTYANGAFSLQVLGAATQPLLQIVPTLTSFDQQSGLYLYGSGFVEDGSTYSFAGATASDTGTNIDVYYGADQNGRAYLNTTALPLHGLGSVRVSTAGGTSAPLALNTVAVSVPGFSVSDIAIDPTTGAIWVTDDANPGHLLHIDPATGATLDSITMTDAFGTPYVYNYAGLQVVPSAFTLNATSVPAGSLLVFNGYPSPDRVIAVNPATGAVIASLALAGNYDLLGGVYDPTSGHLFITENNGPGNRLLELDPVTGALINAITTPINIQTWSGIAIDPITHNLWIGSVNGGPQVIEIKRDGTEVRRVALASQGLDQNEISGLAFSPDGKLWLSSTQGVLYKVDVNADLLAVRSATLTQVLASASDGVAANPAAAAANVGQVIELRGTNFGAGTTVLFNTRDNAGNTGTVAIAPLAINAEGTRLQVIVPDTATTGNIRVVNHGTSNLGFSSYTDSVYRKLTLSFTAGSTTATVRFADGGLEDINNESWGIDNVLVKQGASTVFADDFEAGAKAQWSNQATDASNPGTFTRFSGRFGNGTSGQALNLAGLTAGQTYTLSFDLYAIDSWDGNSTSAGPDLIDVSVDGTSVLRETLANYPGGAQTLNASTGIRLQVVPTLSSISGSLPGQDNQFNLIGSGFMEGASTVTIGGVAFSDSATNLTPFDVTGARNDNMTVVAPRTLDGPIRITTEGGYAQIPASFPAQPASVFTGIVANAAAGVAGNLATASANAGQTITLTGQGFTGSTLVQFQGIDDSGTLGTLTRTGSVGAGGTTLTLTVPALARSGAVTVLGSGSSFTLQVVPTLKSVGGSIAAGNTLVLEGTGLTANDLAIAIDGRGVGSFAVRTIVEGTNGIDQQLVTLTVPAGVGAGLITVSTSGGSVSLRRGNTTITALADLSPAADVGDTIATALSTGLAVNQSIKINSGIAIGLDVDLHRVDLAAGDVLTLNISNAVGYTYLRIFDAAGNQVLSPVFNSPGSANASTRFVAPSGGAFYVGVSGYSNTTYDPKVAGSGNAAGYTGGYTLSLERLAAGTSHLTSITATATSGTPANDSLASANTGQSITFSGAGLVATDRLVFTTLDDSGNLSEVAITSTVDVANQTLTAVVPVNATTGRVRLERDDSGVLLQIVPTLADVTMGAGGGFVGSNLQLSGSGFAEGATSVQIGGQTIADVGRFAGLDVFGSATGINLTVPAGASTGPVRVTTVGGTSTAFGISLSGISASGASGTPANGAIATANAGQSITLNGSGLDATTDVVFQYTDGSGSVGERIVRPTAVNAAGTQLQVLVPIDAISGVVRVVGSADAFPLQILPTITDVQIESVAADGSTAQ
ncbi:MAG: pre-peptidase C-terminal domain-containing protein, partial [Burkholderiaceae bacterium]|nr:pre-peptidase C-terminal domain-containing protein [Burkholderiaceae bacterium]